MRKGLCFLLIGVMTAVLLAGCGGKEGNVEVKETAATKAAAEKTTAAETDAKTQPEETQTAPAQTETAAVPTGSMAVNYSSAFSVDYLEDGSKLVTDPENQRFLIVPQGQKVPEGYDGVTVLEGGAKRAIFFSTTQVGMIAPLDIWDCVAGVAAKEDTDWGNETIVQLLEDGQITNVGSSSEPDYEAVQALNPDIAFVYTGSSAQTDLIAKLEELGIPYAVDNEYMEEDFRGRMEWTKFLGAFFNKEKEAVAYVEEQEAAVEEMEKAIAGAEKPKVAWGLMYSDGTVYVPNGGSYVAKAIETAGGDYLFKDLNPDSSASSQLTPEAFYETLQKADVWIYSSNKKFVADYAALLEKLPIAEDAPVVQNKNVWQFSVDYYARTDRTEEQVIELAKIFHPELFNDGELIHYNRLAD